MTRGQTRKWHMDQQGIDTWTNKDLTREAIRKQHVVEQHNDTWTNKKITRGPTGKWHMDKQENDTWTNRKMTRGETGNWHVAQQEKDMWANKIATHGPTRKRHVAESRVAMWLSPFRHVLNDTSFASVDYGTCLMTCWLTRGLCHMDLLVQWRFRWRVTKQIWFCDGLVFVTDENGSMTKLEVSSQKYKHDADSVTVVRHRMFFVTKMTFSVMKVVCHRSNFSRSDRNFYECTIYMSN